MEKIHVTLPPHLPTICSLTQEPIENAIYTVCKHFFEKTSFEAYGGKYCPLCREEVTWYVDVRKDQLGKTVELEKKKLELKERPIASHVEQATLEIDIAQNLVYISLAHGDTAFKEWCTRKDSSMTAPLDYDKVITDANSGGLKKYPALVENLFKGYSYGSHETVQSFINAFFKEKSNFELYTFLVKRVFCDQVRHGVNTLFGISTSQLVVDEKKVIADAQKGKKLRALIGLTFAICLIIGMSRRFLGKNTPSLA
jgi:hypothetical protein